MCTHGFGNVTLLKVQLYHPLRKAKICMGKKTSVDNNNDLTLWTVICSIKRHREVQIDPSNKRITDHSIIKRH
jgi:hypothetical protein